MAMIPSIKKDYSFPDHETLFCNCGKRDAEEEPDVLTPTYEPDDSMGNSWARAVLLGRVQVNENRRGTICPPTDVTIPTAITSQSEAMQQSRANLIRTLESIKSRPWAARQLAALKAQMLRDRGSRAKQPAFSESRTFPVVDDSTFFIIDFPRATTLATLLGAIRNIGRIFASRLEDNVGVVTFSCRISAARFWERHKWGLVVGDEMARVYRYLNPIPRTGPLNLPVQHTRTILVTGPGAVVNFPTIAAILKTKARARFYTQYVREKSTDGHAVVEWVFGSYYGQADWAYEVLTEALKDNVEGVRVFHADDPSS